MFLSALLSANSVLLLKFSIFIHPWFSLSLFMDTNTTVLQVLLKSYLVCSSRQWDFWDLNTIYFLRKCLEVYSEMPQLFLESASWVAVEAGLLFSSQAASSLLSLFPLLWKTFLSSTSFPFCFSLQLNLPCIFLYLDTFLFFYCSRSSCT